MCTSVKCTHMKQIANILTVFKLPKFHHSSPSIRRPLDSPHDVVPLAEEREPVIQHFLMLVREVGPVGPAFCIYILINTRRCIRWKAEEEMRSEQKVESRPHTLRFQRRLSQRPRSVFACKDFVRAFGSVGLVAADVEDGALNAPSHGQQDEAVACRTSGLAGSYLDGDICRVLLICAW